MTVFECLMVAGPLTPSNCSTSEDCPQHQFCHLEQRCLTCGTTPQCFSNVEKTTMAAKSMAVNGDCSNCRGHVYTAGAASSYRSKHGSGGTYCSKGEDCPKDHFCKGGKEPFCAACLLAGKSQCLMPELQAFDLDCSRCMKPQSAPQPDACVLLTHSTACIGEKCHSAADCGKSQFCNLDGLCVGCGSRPACFERLEGSKPEWLRWVASSMDNDCRNCRGHQYSQGEQQPLVVKEGKHT
jgi:hypothetical protein